MKPLTAMSPIVTLNGHQPTISMSGILQLLSRIAFSGPYTRNHGNHFSPGLV